MGPAAPLKRGPPPSYCPPFFQGRSARDVPPLPIEVRSSPPSPPCASAHNFTTKSPRLRPCARAKERSPWPLQTSTPSRYSSRSIIVSQVRGRVPLLGGGGREVSDERDAAPFIHRPGLRWRLSCLRSFPPLPAYARAPAEGSCPRRDEDPPFQLSLCCWRLSAIRLKTEEEDKLLLTRYLHPTLRFQGFGAVEPPRSPPPPPTSTFSPNLHVFCFLNQFFF